MDLRRWCALLLLALPFGSVLAADPWSLPLPKTLPASEVPPKPADDGLPWMGTTPGKGTTSPSGKPAPKADDPAKPQTSSKPEEKKEEKKGEKEPPTYWGKVPPVQPFARPGYFPIPPKGPGYYSFEDDCHGECSKAPPKYPYPRFSIIPQSFFDIDWRYLEKKDNKEHDCFDVLKRIHCCDDCMLFTTGGEFRFRYNYEENSRLNARGSDNNYDLFRLRAYADLMITNRFRLFAEFISATSPDYRLAPLGIDRNKADFLNLFADLAMCDVHDAPIWLRVGRQELIYGSQRLISTLDWANTRRTFQGIKAFWQSEEFAVDAFLVQPIPVGPNLVGVRNVDRFDSVDNNQIFAGLWNTYRPSKNEAIDAYYLFLDNTNATAGFRSISPNGRPASTTLNGATTVHTIGSRYVGDDDGWLWDVEGMLQFGGFYDQSLFAGAATVSGGYQWKDVECTPMVWLAYDYASGTNNPRVNGSNHTFNQLFPFGHYYFGFIDVVGRRNIHDVSLYATAWPEKWIQTQFQLHNFFLASRRDALYNAAGAPIRQDVTGRAGNYVGTEFDFLVNFHLSKHADILLSYSYLVTGEFIRNTATNSSARDNPQALYAQFSYRW